MVNLIFVELETTGFEPSKDQVIIIAAENESGATFCRRIVPSIPIKPEAREKNGLSMVDGHLYYGCDLLYTNVVNRKKAWSDFIEFVSECPEPFLVGYQLHKQFVQRELHAVELATQFEQLFAGRVHFVDITSIFNEIDPESEGELNLLTRRHLDRTDETWEMFPIPLYRVQLVRGLLNVLEITSDTIERHSELVC